MVIRTVRARSRKGYPANSQPHHHRRLSSAVLTHSMVRGSSADRLPLLIEKAGDVVWTVDMSMRPTYISPSIQRHLGYTVEEAMSMKMKDLFAPHSYQLAMQVLAEELARDQELDTDPDRTRLLEIDLLHKNGHLVPVEICYSILRDGGRVPSGILAVARNITARREAEEYRMASTRKMVDALEQTVQSLARFAEMRDSYTAGHQRRVAGLAVTIANKAGLHRDTVQGLGLAGLIHDIGKVRVPAEILTSPRSLSKAEVEIIRTHPSIGHEILSRIDFPWPIAEAVHQHHERLDGSGYPKGLVGRNIILEARILGVSDVVEAMASDRPYRPALGIDAALEEISEQRGALYDPFVVDACLEVFQRDGYRFDKEPSANAVCVGGQWALPPHEMMGLQARAASTFGC